MSLREIPASQRPPPARRPVPGSGFRVRWDRVALLVVSLTVLTMLAVRSASADHSPASRPAASPANAATGAPATGAPASRTSGGAARPARCPETTSTVIRQAPAAAAPGQRTVALTFDDGPSADTPQVLALLGSSRIRATFFMIGRLAQANPATVHAVASSGNQVGNHSWSHRPPSSSDGWRAGVIDTEISRSEAVLRQLTGGAVCWFRPPAGILTGLAPAARAHHQNVTLWSVDTRDWAVQRPGTSTAAATRTIVANARAGLHQAHPVVLMHDGGGRRDATIAALPQIIALYRAHGYAFVRLDGR